MAEAVRHLPQTTDRATRCGWNEGSSTRFVSSLLGPAGQGVEEEGLACDCLVCRQTTSDAVNPVLGIREEHFERYGRVKLIRHVNGAQMFQEDFADDAIPPRLVDHDMATAETDANTRASQRKGAKCHKGNTAYQEGAEKTYDSPENASERLAG